MNTDREGLAAALYRGRWGDEEYDLMFNDRSTAEIRGMRDECDRDADAILASDWLAAHDRAVAQQALRDAADALTASPDHARWLHDRADKLGTHP